MSDVLQWRRLRRWRLSRRVLLKASVRAGIGAVGLALVGCGDDEAAEEAVEGEEAQADEQAGAEAQADEQVVAEGEEAAGPEGPLRGGIAQLFAATEIHDRWDPHRSRFSQTQSFHSLMYNRLIRFASVSAGTLEGDLTDLPEMPDEQTYIFRVRPDARFWSRPPANGRPFTAEDIRLNIQRQIDGVDEEGNTDRLFFRQPAFRRTASLEVQDSRTIVLTTEEPDSTYLTSLIAGPWGWMVNPEAAEEFGNEWVLQRDDVSLSAGTGPFVPVSYGRGEELALARSDNWWKEEGAYLDGLILRRTPNEGIAQAYRGGQYDRVDFPLSKTEVESLRAEFPDHLRYEFPIDTAVQLALNVQDIPENPLRDPRLVRALSIAIDRFEMIERLYLGDGRPSGPVPWFFEGWTIAEEELLTRAGYQPDKSDDLAEVEALVSAAGGVESFGDLEITVPDLFEGFFPGIAESLKAMLERNLGLQVRTRFLNYEQISERLQEGTLPAFFGWGGPPEQADPTDRWLRTAHSEGAENWGRYANAEVDELVERMRGSFAVAERQRLAREVQELLLATGFWVQNVTNGIQLGIGRPYLHVDSRAVDFGWAAHHLDKTWIDTSDAEYPSERELPALEEEEEEE